MEPTLAPLALGKGITDFGFMAITSAFYLLCTGLMMGYFIKWFVKMVDQLITQQQAALTEIVKHQGEQTLLMSDIKERQDKNWVADAQTISHYVFEEMQYLLLKDLLRTQKENHIADKLATKEKLQLACESIYTETLRDLNGFQYHGKPLSSCMNPTWVAQLLETLLTELYHTGGENIHRSITSFYLICNKMQAEFNQQFTSP